MAQPLTKRLVTEASLLTGNASDIVDQKIAEQGGSPDGGTTGQVLAKVSDADHDVAWQDPGEADVTSAAVAEALAVDGPAKDEVTAQIDEQAPAAAAEAMGNPESALNSETAALVAELLGGGVAGLVRYVDARGDTNTPRPAGWLGAVLWKISEGDPNPAFYDEAKQDMVVVIEVAPLPFDPSQIPGVTAWFDAVALDATLNQGDELASWPNLIAGGPAAVPMVTDVGPTFAAAGIHSGPSVLFNGTNGVLKASGFAPYAGRATIYAVVYSTPATTSGTDFFYDGSSAAVTTLQQGLGRNATGQWVVYAGDSFTKTTATNAVHLVKVDVGNPTSTLTVDNASSQAGTTNDGPLITAISLGGRGDGANVLDGFLGCFIYVRGTVASEVHTQVVEYLSDRYALGLV